MAVIATRDPRRATGGGGRRSPDGRCRHVASGSRAPSPTLARTAALREARVLSAVLGPHSPPWRAALRPGRARMGWNGSGISQVDRAVGGGNPGAVIGSKGVSPPSGPGGRRAPRMGGARPVRSGTCRHRQTPACGSPPSSRRSGGRLRTRPTWARRRGPPRPRGVHPPRPPARHRRARAPWRAAAARCGRHRADGPRGGAARQNASRALMLRPIAGATGWPRMPRTRGSLRAAAGLPDGPRPRGCPAHGPTHASSACRPTRRAAPALPAGAPVRAVEAPALPDAGDPRIASRLGTPWGAGRPGWCAGASPSLAGARFSTA